MKLRLPAPWRLLVLFWLPVVLLLTWWFTSANSQNVFFPPLSSILDAFRTEWLFARVPTDLLPSLGRFGVGFAIACVAGAVVGVIIGRSLLLQRAFTPLIDFLRAVPPPAIVPLALLLLGIGPESKIFVISFGAFFPVLLNVIDGVRGIDSLYLDVGRVYRLSQWERIRHIIFPNILPSFFTGARLGMAIALILMVVTEMIGSTDGLGYVVLTNQQRYAIPAMWAGIFMIGIIGFAVNQIFVLIERSALSWYSGWKGHQDDLPVLKPKTSATAGGATRKAQTR